MKCQHDVTRNACLACLRAELEAVRNNRRNIIADFKAYRERTAEISKPMFTSTGPSPEQSLDRIAWALEGIQSAMVGQWGPG